MTWPLGILEKCPLEKWQDPRLWMIISTSSGIVCTWKWCQIICCSVSFDLIYYIHGFDGVFKKNHVFRDVGSTLTTSFFVQSNLGLEIENGDHSWPCFDALKLTVVSVLTKQPPFKITFFEVRLELSFRVKNWFFLLSGLDFKIWAYP